MYVMNGIGQQTGHCPVRPNMCFSAANERDSARTMCQHGYVPPVPTGPCPSGNVIDSSNLRMFSPCKISHFGLCSPEEDPRGQVAMMQQQRFGTQQQSSEQQSSEDSLQDEDDEDYTMYYVLGGLGILAVGGVAYFMTKKK